MIFILVLLLHFHVVQVDWDPPLSTYGVSVGTSTHYCSLEWAEYHPVFACESE